MYFFAPHTTKSYCESLSTQGKESWIPGLNSITQACAECLGETWTTWANQGHKTPLVSAELLTRKWYRDGLGRLCCPCTPGDKKSTSKTERIKVTQTDAKSCGPQREIRWQQSLHPAGLPVRTASPPEVSLASSIPVINCPFIFFVCLICEFA